MRLTHLSISGFRCLKDLDLEMRPLMVLIGPNGAGKTSVLDLFSLLRDAMLGDLGKALSDRGGLLAILSWTPSPDSWALRIELEAGSLPSADSLRYELGVMTGPLLLALIRGMGSGARPVDYLVTSELLTQGQRPSESEPLRLIERTRGQTRFLDPQAGTLEEPDWAFNPQELALAQVPRTYRQAEELRRFLSQTRHFAQLDTGKNAPIRNPQELRPSFVPGPNGTDLVATLYHLKSSRDPFYERIEDALRAGFPSFRGLEFPPVAAGQAILAWYEEPFPGPFYPQQLSEGTLRFLWLTTILLSPSPPPIVMIDEPEISLHPELLKVLSGLLRDAAARTQVIVATQSAELIRWLSPEELVVMDKEEGFARARWADSMDVRSWLERYTLGELWVMGELGGRP